MLNRLPGIKKVNLIHGLRNLVMSLAVLGTGKSSCRSSSSSSRSSSNRIVLVVVVVVVVVIV